MGLIVLGSAMTIGGSYSIHRFRHPDRALQLSLVPLGAPNDRWAGVLVGVGGTF